MRSRCLLLALTLALPTPALAAQPGDVSIQVHDQRIDFLLGSDLIGSYHKGPNVAKPYMWPLNAPGGVAITRAWPMLEGQAGETKDHLHQKSAWFCHGDVIPEGIELKQRVKGVEGVDFWAESKGHGVIACVDVGSPRTDKKHGQVSTRNEWRTADGKNILDEARTIHLYDLGSASLLVFDIDLHASVCPITFGDTKEGSFGIRIHDRLTENRKGGKLENAEGKIGMKNIWGLPSPWCDYSGQLDGKTVGLTIFDDPANSSPAYWHSRDYGLMAANPFARARSGFPGQRGKTDLVKLAQGDHLKLRYGIFLHAGDAKEGKIAEAYERFVKLKGK